MRMRIILPERVPSDYRSRAAGTVDRRPGGGMTFRSHPVNARADTVTTTLIQP